MRSSIFDEDTPHEIIAALQPDVLVKGADWAEDAIVGRDIVEARGGRVVRVPVEPGYSTTLDRRETHSSIGRAAVLTLEVRTARVTTSTSLNLRARPEDRGRPQRHGRAGAASSPA